MQYNISIMNEADDTNNHMDEVADFITIRLQERFGVTVAREEMINCIELKWDYEG